MANRSLHSQLLHFIVVILTIEDRPFLRAFDDGAPLAFDFLPRSLIDARLLHEQRFDNLADFEADGIAVFDELDVIQLSDSIGDYVSEFVDFVAAQSHSREVLQRVFRLQINTKERPCIS
jgi:hypothetical protein